MTLLDPRVHAALLAHGISYEEFACDPQSADTAVFCERYGFDPHDSANAILVASRKVEPPRYALCVVLATTKLDVNRQVSELLGVRRLSFADADTTIALTGMMIGGVTPFGIDGMPIYVDQAVLERGRVIVGGGNRSSKVLVAPAELLRLPTAQAVAGLALPRG